jgi:hypothetical protein
MLCHSIALLAGPVKNSALNHTGVWLSYPIGNMMCSLGRVLCRITVPRLVTYKCGTLTGHPDTLHSVCRQFSRIQFSQKTEAKLKSTDKIPSEFTLIYRAPMASYMNLAQAVSSISVLLLGGVGAYKYVTDATGNFPLTFKINELNTLGDIQIDGELLVYFSAFIIFNVGIWAMTLRYPLRIYHHEGTNSYICVLKGFLPLNTKNISFSAGEIRKHIPLMYSLLPWRDAMFKVGKKTMYILENYFRTPADFNTMFNKV